MHILFEGAPATGKSTVAKHLALHHGFYRVPEVNEMFPRRPVPEPQYWYCARQLDRCRRARQHSKSILDGDPLQGVWFSWMYPERGFPVWSQSLSYFESQIDSVFLPYGYIHLRVDESVRYERERVRERDRGHSHEQFLSKWQRYADFSGPQAALIDAMRREYPGWVFSVEAAEFADTVQKILDLEFGAAPSAADFVGWLRDWLSNHYATDYRT